MKPAFHINAAGKIESVLIEDNKRSNVFGEGTDLVFNSDLDLGYYGNIPTGTVVTVSEHAHDTGQVELVIISPVSLISEWGRRITLVPFMTEDAIAALSCRCKQV